MRRSRIAIGLALSIIFVGIVMPLAFWGVASFIDRAAGFKSIPMNRPVELILTGMIWSLGMFWIFWAYSYLHFVGQGSPFEAFGVALEPTKRLVTAGPFAYVRNPMIFGLLLILTGLAFLLDSIAGLILIPFVALLAAAYLRIFEEKELKRRFGMSYEHYRQDVPMLIPQITPYTPPATHSSNG